MSLQDILQKIYAQADQKIQEIQHKAEKDKSKVKQEISETEREAFEKLEQNTDQSLQSIDIKTDTMARRENRQALLNAKRQILDQALQAFLDHLLAADNSSKEKIFKAQHRSLGLNEGTLRVAVSDTTLVETIFGKNFQIQKDDKIKGGFIAVSNGMEIDASFENLVFGEYRQPLEMYFTDQLKLV